MSLRKSLNSVYEEFYQCLKGITVYGSKIKCPRNYILIPGKSPYKVIPNPHMQGVSQGNINYLNRVFQAGLRKFLYARDKQGNLIQDFNNYYQPNISPAYALEHIYDPENPICKFKCKNKCVRQVGGGGNIGLIKRLRPE